MKDYASENANVKDCRSTTNSKELKTSLSRVFTALIPALLLCAFFLPSASSKFRYAYRDVASYYYPLFEQIQRNWEAGIPPLWNPYVNLGQPLAGDPTASVFYPGKLLFFLSSAKLLSFALCFKLYLWLHVALAFYAASKLARTLGISAVGANISGLSYAFSGQVLFQYTNVVYLVGAAWAPLHFVYALAFFRGKKPRKRIAAICKLSFVLSVTILGGEPQIVYLTLLSSTIMALFFKWTPNVAEEERKRPLIRKIALASTFLIGTTSASFLLSAVQVLPSLELTERSTRENEEGIRSLWDVPKAFNVSQKSGVFSTLRQKGFYQNLLCQDFSTGGRSESIYRFSVGPWRWLEFLFPNVGGKQYPQNSRWFEIFPEELALWTPSLYFGVAPFALALATARIRRRSPTENVRVAATWLAIFGLLGALGGYGLGWFLHIICDFISGSPISPVFRDGDPVGGLYWLLVLTAPKFATFRYPAKLATLVAIAFSTLAGIGWDEEKFSRRFKRIVITILCAALVGAVVMFTTGEKIFSGTQLPSNPLFGPFQEKLAAKTVLEAFAQTTAFLFAFFALTIALKRTDRRQSKGTRRNLIIAGLLTVVASDVYAANNWLVSVAPSKLFESDSSIVGKLTTGDNAPPLRIYRSPIWFPPIFQTHSSPRRIEERVLWDVETLYPIYPSTSGIAMLDVREAFMEKEFAQFADSAASGANLDEELAFLDVYGILGPRFWTKRISPDDENQVPFEQPDWRVEFKRIEAPASRATLVRNQKPVATSEKDCVNILKYSSNELAFLVVASDPSELIVSEQYWPDWKVSLIPVEEKTAEAFQAQRLDARRLDETLSYLKTTSGTTEGAIEPAFGFLRKTRVPQGRTCVVMSYCPKALRVGGVVSTITWLVLTFATTSQIVVRRARRRRQLEKEKETNRRIGRFRT